jgi:Flp pilus assembly protein TadD
MSDRLERGRAALKSGQFAVAAGEAREHLATHADAADAWALLGAALLGGGRASEAVDALRSGGPDCRSDLAAALIAADRAPEARTLLETLVRERPDDARERIQLAHLCLASGRGPEGAVHLERAARRLGGDDASAATSLASAVRRAFESEVDASQFLEAHAVGYREAFLEAVAPRLAAGWFAEAARMARGADGQPVPARPEGSRPYAVERVDAVDPATGEIGAVGSGEDPCIVAVEGYEPLAAVATLLPWRDQAVPAWVSSRCPWHWMPITFVSRRPERAAVRVAAAETLWAPWYLQGFNGAFGSREEGRFHYTSDPEPVGETGVAFRVDLGLARPDAIAALLGAAAAAADRIGLGAVVFGEGLLPDAPWPTS